MAVKTPTDTSKGNGRYGQLRSGGKPGNKGGGRQPEEFRAWCRNLVEGKAHVREIRKILNDSAHTHFAKISTLFYAYGYGQPTATLDIKTTTRYVVRMPEVPESTADWLERYKPENLSQRN